MVPSTAPAREWTSVMQPWVRNTELLLATMAVCLSKHQVRLALQVDAPRAAIPVIPVYVVSGREEPVHPFLEALLRLPQGLTGGPGAGGPRRAAVGSISAPAPG